ncbi:MAG: hypothetical protein RL226_567 [Bacteroidota bacterium]
MKIEVSFRPHPLQFKRPARTSRDVLTTKPSWLLYLRHEEKTGIGEVSIIEGLSPETSEITLRSLQTLARTGFTTATPLPDAHTQPALRFALETALLSLQAQDPLVLFPSSFTSGLSAIPINGLVWMDQPESMKKQASEKISEGFKVIKMKVGALDFADELRVLEWFRTLYPPDQYILRLDANGAFRADEALQKLEKLAPFHVHSIEQPIRQNQHNEMRKLVTESPIPIALDEELIANDHPEETLDFIRPHYVILKPSLHGGLAACEQIIAKASDLKIGWWATSALESNIGLNAIAQWAATKNNPLPQGLGTGSLYTNNIPSPLVVKQGHLHYTSEPWQLPS